MKNKLYRYPNPVIIKAQQKVTKLQNEIVLDLEQDQYKQALKKANNILRSKEARILAIHRVTTNKGFRSRGFSKRYLNTELQFSQMLSWLWKKPKLYKSDPLLRIDQVETRRGQFPFHLIKIDVYKLFGI